MYTRNSIIDTDKAIKYIEEKFRVSYAAPLINAKRHNKVITTNITCQYTPSFVYCYTFNHIVILIHICVVYKYRGYSYTHAEYKLSIDLKCNFYKQLNIYDDSNIYT